MPSAFTHGFVGAAVAGLAPTTRQRLRLAVELAVLSALPDLDVLAFRFGVPYASPFGHRGFTHSLTVAALLAVLYPLVLHRDARPFGRTWWMLVGLAFAAEASHGLLDTCTDAGLGVALLWPFSDARFFFPWRPIRTSPLSPGAFVSRLGALILLNEMLWVWLPVLTLLAIHALLRRRSRPKSRRSLSP